MHRFKDKQAHCKNKFNLKGHGIVNLVGATVRYEMMKFCTGSVQDTMRRYHLLSDDTGSVEGTKWRSEQVSQMPH